MIDQLCNSHYGPYINAAAIVLYMVIEIYMGRRGKQQKSGSVPELLFNVMRAVIFKKKKGI